MTRPRMSSLALTPMLTAQGNEDEKVFFGWGGSDTCNEPLEAMLASLQVYICCMTTVSATHSNVLLGESPPSCPSIHSWTFTDIG
jgi:hypothetical protein